MFIQLLVSVENEGPFGLLYCITFKLMDQQWLAMHASYMNFNVCMPFLMKTFNFLYILLC